MEADKKSTSPTTIDAYIAGFPEETRVLLEQVRSTIREHAPGAQEKIGYGIPTFTLEGNLVHFAGYKNHIGFYPGAAGIEAFQDKFSGYKSAKGSVQFPIEQPMPLELIAEVVRYRVAQNLEKKKGKKGKKGE